MSDSADIDLALEEVAMAKPCSLDVRMRVIDEIEAGASRREAAEWLNVSPSSAVKWM